MHNKQEKLHQHHCICTADLTNSSNTALIHEATKRYNLVQSYLNTDDHVFSVGQIRATLTKVIVYLLAEFDSEKADSEFIYQDMQNLVTLQTYLFELQMDYRK